MASTLCCLLVLDLICANSRTMTSDGDKRLGLGILSAAEIAKKNVRGISKNTKGVGTSKKSSPVLMLSCDTCPSLSV